MSQETRCAFGVLLFNQNIPLPVEFIPPAHSQQSDVLYI